MSLTPKLEIKQTPTLLLTPELRQAINLLQMNNIELNEVIEQELASNPLLEREDEYLTDTDTISSDTTDELSQSDKEEEITIDSEFVNEFDDFGSDTTDLEYFESPSWEDYNQSKTKLQDDDNFDYFEKKLSQKESLSSLLDKQINLTFFNFSDRLLARLLSEQLDDAGYFCGNISETANKLSTTPQRLRLILDKLKQFEPSGIFAENLSECLKIQLADKKELSPKMEILLDNLPLLADKKLKSLSLLCQCDISELTSLINKIKSLNPKPTASYYDNSTSYVIPDIFITRNNLGEYRVELNSMTLPRLLINHRYYTELKKDKKVSRYLKDNLSRASFLIKAMQQRATTILHVSEEIVLRQYHFFEKGIEYLRPLSLRDISTALNISESTVSRVTTGKYMSTPRGLFELKYFFSGAAGSYIGNEDTSTTTIKHKIKTMINNESSHNILSDEKIVSLLEQEGIKIARRTVTKYREALGIATSGQRKKAKRV